MVWTPQLSWIDLAIFQTLHRKSLSTLFLTLVVYFSMSFNLLFWGHGWHGWCKQLVSPLPSLSSPIQYRIGFTPIQWIGIKYALGKCFFIIGVFQSALCLKLRYQSCALTLWENVLSRQTQMIYLPELSFFGKASLVWSGYTEKGALDYVCTWSRESSHGQWWS